MGIALSIEQISHSGGIVDMARKGKNQPHYMMAAPNMIGTWDVETACGRTLGKSSDDTIEMGPALSGTLCKRCERLYAAMLDAQESATAEVPAAGEESAPALPGTETLGITGLTESQMRDAVTAHYASGHSVPAEVAALPDPTVKRVQWSGTDAGDAGAVVTCDYKGDVEIINPEKTHGKCPECRAYITLLDVKSDPDAQRIGKHNRYGVATPAGAGLSSKSVDTVEHGSIPGDPAAADKRRAEESRCKRSGKILAGAEGGTVDCPDCARPVKLIKKTSQTKKGPKIKWQVPEHVDSRDTFRRSGKGERKVTPRGTGADAGKGQRDHGSVDGSATTGRQNMPPVRPGGWVGKAGTMSLPATVRPGIDPEVSGKICPICLEAPEIAHAGMTRSARRRHSTKVGAVLRERAAQREARKAAEIAKGEAIPAAQRRALRKAASVGSFAEGVNAHTGTVTHAPRPAKGASKNKSSK